MDLRRLTPILVLVALGAALWLSGRESPPGRAAGAGGSGSPSSTPAPETGTPTSAPSTGTLPGVPPPATGRKADRPAGYAPATPTPTDAIPGGSLKAHEGLYGAHTIARHVGRSLDDLKARADEEGKREVSTFTDLATADRAVAEVLFREQERIRRWLAARPASNEAFEDRLAEAVGDVYRRDSRKTTPGHTVVVVLRASEKFPEGFRIHTAYVSLP